MLISRAVTAVASALLAACISASSTVRNPLRSIDLAKNPSILTPNNRVTAQSKFDVAFDMSGRRVRLSLEPNEDIFVEGATMQILRADGTISTKQPIDRLLHKVYKGAAWLKRGDRWDNVGWARIVVHRDGVQPLFEGAFTVHHDHHHVQLASNYKNTRQALDPDVDLRDDEYMVLFRDSDISTHPEHMELRKRDGDVGCRSDALAFNMDAEHPVYASMRRRDVDDSLFSSAMSTLVGKRQLDGNPPGGGNGAGVNLVQSIGSTKGCPTARKVALVGVAVDCNYRAEFPDANATRANIIEQMNSASALFEDTMNISLGLANILVTEAQCPTTVQQATPWNQACGGNVDIQERLNLFSQWRGKQDDGYSHWTLLSTCKTESAVGLAWLGQACVAGAQGNNSAQGETVAGANVVVRTSTEWQVIAHETGHTFGAVHDCTSTTCQDANMVNAQQCCPLSANQCDAGEKFIMNPSTAQGITNFSLCSIGNICSALGRNSVKSNCLTNNRGVVTVSGERCGNGIVEGDEECDCGGPGGCGDNKCCDPQTCRFKGSAVCDDSNEDCCRECQFATADTVCRASSSSCDPEEKCSGSSPYCPEDKTQPDGSDCGNGLKCASGQCTSRDQQCKTIMGSYTQGNDTYACDNSNCMLSCASPEFGRGVCYGLQQNFLDGTPCTGGGTCQNGRCDGSSFGKEVKSWIDDHKNIVIGVGSGIGGIVLFSILLCCRRSYNRRKTRKMYTQNAAARRGPPSRAGSHSRSRPEQSPPNMAQNSMPPPPMPGPWRPGMNMGGQGGAVPQPPPGVYRSPSMRYA